jgi:ubiquitin carboxyl-terminal hydrolase 9/24
LYDIGPILDKKFAETFLPSFKELVLQRIESITTKDLKDLSKETVSEILVRTKKLLSDSLRKMDLEQLEKTELNLILKLFKSPYMEKRLKGLNEIKELIERVSKNNWYKETTWLSSKILSDWIINEQIIQQIFTYSHGEMLKRVSDILIFLYKNDGLSNEHLELLWDSCIGKHDSLIIETQKTIMELSMHIKLEMQLYLYKKMKSVSLHDYDEKFLKMVKEFCVKTLDQAYHTKTSLDDFGLEIFTPLIDDNCLVNFCEIAINCIEELLRHPKCKDKIYKYLQICMDNVSQGQSVPQSLKLFKALVSIPYISNINEENLKKLDIYTGGIIDKVLSNFETYMKKGTMDYESIIQGRYTHKLNIKIRLKTLEYTMTSNMFNFTFSHFKVLWKIFVLSPNCSGDSELFFKWLNKASKGRVDIINLVKDIFEGLFCGDLKVVCDNIVAFECFKTQFLAINNYHKFIEMRAGGFHSRVSRTVMYLDNLYQISMQSNNNEISQNSGIFLVILNLKLSKSAMLEKIEIWDDFINNCLKYIEESQSNTIIITKVLKIFQLFLEEVLSVPPAGPIKQISCYYRSNVDREYQKLIFSSTDTLRMIRKRLSEIYKRPLGSITVRIDNCVYDSSNDSVYMSIFKSNVIYVEFSANRTIETSPKEFLAQNQQVQDLLFNLLSDPNNSYCTEAWALLTSLPVNERIKKQLIDLDEDINAIIDHNSLYKMLYCLVIVKELVKDSDWMAKFKEKNGITYTLELFKEKDVLVLSPSTSFKYGTVMIVLMEEFFKSSADIDEKFIERIMDCLLVIGKYTQDPDDEEIVCVARTAKNIFSEIIKENKPIVVNSFKNYLNIDQLIEFSLLTCNNKYYPNSIMNLYLEITTSCPEVSPFLVKKLFEQLGKSLENKNSFNYWNLLSHIIKENSEETNIKKEIRRIKKILEDREPEISSKEKDVVLWGILSLLKVFIECDYMKVKSKFLRFILNECLFETSSPVHKNPPKCKSDDNRQLAFGILEIACEKKPGSLNQIITYLSKFHEDPHWRTGKYTDWNYSPVALEKSTTGYVGLKNLGNICYMNSTLQQLFNIPTFCNQILNAKEKSENPEESVLYHLQFIFSGLRNSAKQYINPKKLCLAFKDWEGKPINILEQMDADEYFNNLMDKLEGIMKGDPHENCIKNHFGGIQTTECIGKKGCNHRSERKEGFLTLPVQVKNKKTIQESLESFVEGEILEGDNAYQCDYCETKVTALRRVCIKHLPNILIIVLRRFEFDFDTMTRVKVNDYCEFPLEIDMEPYTQEGLERKEIIKELLKNEGSTKEVPPRKFPDDYYKFNIKGIVIHTGTAESGHYYSYIQDRKSNKWHEFNDTLVYPFDPEDIPSEAFGGVEKWQSVYSSNFMASNREKYRNAYLLFYEREHKYSHRSKDDDGLEELNLPEEKTKDVQFQEVFDDNERYWRCKSTFSPEYFVFVVRLLKLNSAEVTKFACAFFLVIFIRSKDLSKIPEFMQQLEENLKRFENVREWMSEVICVKGVLKELILECPIAEKRKLIVGVFDLAFEGLSNRFRVKVFSSMLNKFKLATSSKFSTSYFELLFILAKRDPEACSRCEVVPVILSYLKNEEFTVNNPEEYENEDIYLGYTSDFPETDRTDKFSCDETGKSLSYVGALLGLFVDYFTPDQVKQVFDKSIMDVLIQINHKIGTRYIGLMYSKLCTKSKEKTKEYNSVLVSAFKDNDFDKAKIYFRQFTALLKVEDEFQSERTEIVLKSLIDTIKEYKNYSKITEVSIDFIFKIAGRIPAAREWIYSKIKEIRWIEAWLKDSSYQQSRQSINMYKKNTTSIIPAPQSSRSNSDRYELIKKLFKAQFPDQSSEWDSDDDIPPEFWKSSEKICIYDPMIQKWVKGIVLHNLVGLISVRIENTIDKQNKWYEIQSDFITPDRTKAIKYTNR